MSMQPQELIRIKRGGGELSDEAIRQIIASVADGSAVDYQLSALLMAIFFRGMSGRELSTWTDAMVHSGRVVDLSAVPGPKVDKHSTGGVGDKVSICLAPLVAACGVNVPMISGRGLLHTGGTLDKLEAIPGFDVRLGVERFIEVLRDTGLALIGQTDDLAPADRRLYALRDVTATVESIPLIASSIMSKKLAEGIDGLVLDVKVGSGAFMQHSDEARELARTIIEIGARAGKRVVAVISDMNQPLGREVGNANETREAIEILRGGGPDDLWALTRELAVQMLLLGGAVPGRDAAEQAVETARVDGSALRRLRECVRLQGGDPAVVDDPGLLPRARHHLEVPAQDSGLVVEIDTRQVGLAAMTLGAGRQRIDQPVNPAVGLTFHARLGNRVNRGDSLATLHHDDPGRVDEARSLIGSAVRLADSAAAVPPLIHEVLG